MSGYRIKPPAVGETPDVFDIWESVLSGHGIPKGWETMFRAQQARLFRRRKQMETISIIEAFSKLGEEIGRAREKFPPREMLGEALAEEVGEWARSVNDGQPSGPGNIEALHVACVALRIYMEGSTETDLDIINEMIGLEMRARELLTKEGAQA